MMNWYMYLKILVGIKFDSFVPNLILLNFSLHVAN